MPYDVKKNIIRTRDFVYFKLLIAVKTSSTVISKFCKMEMQFALFCWSPSCCSGTLLDELKTEKNIH